jgi:hypothetical protein
MPLFLEAENAGGRDRRPAEGPPRSGRRAAAAYSSLMVALYVAGPAALVTLTVHDHVQLDRVTGASAERYGGLLSPGTTSVRLAAGTYIFRTTSDAKVQLGQGTSAHVRAVAVPNNKGDWPDLSISQIVPAAKGDGPPDHVPTLTVLQ